MIKSVSLLCTVAGILLPAVALGANRKLTVEYRAHDLAKNVIAIDPANLWKDSKNGPVELKSGTCKLTLARAGQTSTITPAACDEFWKAETLSPIVVSGTSAELVDGGVEISLQPVLPSGQAIQLSGAVSSPLMAPPN